MAAVQVVTRSGMSADMKNQQITRTSFKHLHENTRNHLRRFMQSERGYRRSRMNLSAMEIAVYLTLGVLLLSAWAVYPIFERLR